MGRKAALHSSSGSSGRVRKGSGAGSRSLSRPLIPFFIALIAAVLVGCTYTYEQLVVGRLLNRLEELEVARRKAHQELMGELGAMREVDSRKAVEDAAREAGLLPPAPEQVIVLDNPLGRS